MVWQKEGKWYKTIESGFVLGPFECELHAVEAIRITQEESFPTAKKSKVASVEEASAPAEVKDESIQS